VSHRHDAGPKPKRQGKRKASGNAEAKAERASGDFYPHPVFGPIPRIDVSVVQADGSVFVFRDYDPDYAPPLPKGAVRGNVRNQSFCRMCHVPRYFYVDRPGTCVQCGGGFVFRAAEQKHWYESLKFHFDSVAVRCLECRRKRRSERSLQQELSDVKARLAQEPDSAAAQLGVAAALVRYRQRTGLGSLDEALAAARKARRLLKGHPASDGARADFWEASCQALAGRHALARPLFERFVERAHAGKRGATLLAEARAWLERLELERRDKG
jgi:Probable zinc-ribbon domain